MLKKTLIIFLLFINIVCFSFKLYAKDNVKILFDSISAEIDKIYFYKGENSRELLSELYALVPMSADSSFLFSQCLYKEAQLNYAQGTITSTLSEQIRNQMTLRDKQHYPFENAMLSFSLGSQLSATGDYSEAFAVSLQALEQFQILNDSLFITRTLDLLGTICSHISLWRMSQDYYSRALNYISPDQSEYSLILLHIYRLKLREKDNKSTIFEMKELLSELEEEHDLNLLITGYLNLGAFYFSEGDYDEAYIYWNRINGWLDEIDNPRVYSTLYQNLGAYYIMKYGNYDKAINYLESSKEISEKNSNLVHLSYIYNIIGEVYEEIGERDSAYVYMKKHQALSQRLIPNPKAIEAYQAYVSTFLEISENKLIIAQQEIELRKRQFLVVLAVTISLIMTVLLLLLFIRQQKRKKEDEKRELSKQLQHEKEIQVLEKEKQEELLAAKTREITTYSLLLSNKNSILKQILDLNNQLTRDQKDIKEVTHKIDNIIQSNFHVDEDWHDFKVHFEKVHPSFFDKLKQYCNGLTENNLRMCAYFRIGMSTKQIAQILHISPGSVSIHRHRLKKKLGLSEADDLDVFLRSF